MDTWNISSEFYPQTAKKDFAAGSNGSFDATAPRNGGTLAMAKRDPQPAPEVSVVMPCLDEAATLAICIKKALRCFEENGVDGEVIIADNNSRDASAEIARRHGARVVDAPLPGYGSALMTGIEAARGKYIIMGDADDSYDFSKLMGFIGKLREGNDLVLGSRFRGGIEAGAMPPLHRYFGNPVLTRLSRLFFRCPTSDIYCGMRGFTRDAYDKMHLLSTGMEFAVEMVIKGKLLGLNCTEIPTTLSKDGRDHPPHLRSWRDGWRTLRFMLLFSPRIVFLYPGMALMLVGMIATLLLLGDTVKISHVGFDVQTLLYAVAAIIIGYQGVLTYRLAKKYTHVTGLDLSLPKKRDLFFDPEHDLETTALLGAGMFALGVLVSIMAVARWGILAGFGPLDLESSLRIVIPAVGLMIMGAETFVASFFLGLIGLKRK